LDLGKSNFDTLTVTKKRRRCCCCFLKFKRRKINEQIDRRNVCPPFEKCYEKGALQLIFPNTYSAFFKTHSLVRVESRSFFRFHLPCYLYFLYSLMLRLLTVPTVGIFYKKFRPGMLAVSL